MSIDSNEVHWFVLLDVQSNTVILRSRYYSLFHRACARLLSEPDQTQCSFQVELGPEGVGQDLTEEILQCCDDLINDQGEIITCPTRLVYLEGKGRGSFMLLPCEEESMA